MKMDDRMFKKYSNKRKELIEYYKNKKLKNIFCILGIAFLVVVIDVALSFIIKYIAVTLIVGAMVVMFSIIYMRIRVVTINHAMQQKLQQFEQDFELYEKN